MEKFSELSHAFVVASFYRELKEQFAKRGVEAFVHMTIVYARERGSRMAQRAIRDGVPLDFSAYRRYGEWASTELAEEVMGGFESRTLSLSPHHEEHIDRCPWAWQFEQMELKECGVVYCAHLDRAIAAGFNPYLVFDVPQSVNDHECCIQIMRDANFTEDETFEKNPKNVRGFDYHTAHVFHTFARLSESMFGSEGREAADSVLDKFQSEYTDSMAQVLRSFADTNFQVIKP